MATYQIITDSACDLTAELIEKLNISVVPLNMLLKGELRQDSVGDGIKEVYEALRQGEVATTSAANPEHWTNVIEPILKEGKDVLVLAFSSGLSTTYQSAVIAASDLAETYPQRTVKVVDTRCASLGQGLLVHHTCAKRDEGLSLEELTDWVEEHKLNLCHWFTVDDLMFLKRGGRVSATTALVGTMLQIKPVLHVDDEGHLINVSKARGRKASLEALAAKVGEDAIEPEKQTMFISHGDCLEDAEYVAKILQEKYHVPEIHFNHVGPVIGSHTGPGVVAMFYFGKKR